MTISQTDVRARRAPGKPGQLYDLSAEEIDFTNSHPQAQQVSTAVVGTVADANEFTLTLNGIDLVVTAGGSDTKITIAAALAAAVNNDPVVRANVSAVSDGIDTVTLTGVLPGVAFTIAATGNLTPATPTAAAAATPIPFGRVCVRGSASALDVYPNRLGRLPLSADTSIDDLALGISTFTYESEGVEYAPNERVAAIKRGRIWVECAAAVAEDDVVYVGTAPGEEGKIFKASGSGRKALALSVCRFFKSRADDGLAVVECNFR